MPPKLAQKDFKGWESRIGIRAIPETLRQEDDMTIIEAVITTEKAAEVVDWEKWEMVNEVLLMDGSIVPETKQIPLLDSHQRFAVSSLRGSIRNIRTEGEKMIGDVYFSTDAEKEIKLVKEGHLTDLSVGYKISKTDTVEIQPGQELTFDVNGKSRTMKNEDTKMRLLVRTKWWAKEGSLVAIGADDTAKFRNELQNIPPDHKIRADDPELQKIIDEAVNKKINSIQIKPKGEKEMPPDITELTVEQRADQAASVEVERRMSIHETAKQYGKNYKPGETKLKEYVQEAIEKKYSVDYVKSHILDNFDSSKSVDIPLSDLDMSEKEKGEYDFLAGINSILNGNFGKGKSGKVKEASDEIAKRLTSLGVTPHDNSFFVPNEYWGKSLPSRMFNLSSRAMNTGTPSAGGNLVGEDYRGDLFIELLRSKLALGQAGVSMLTGLKENIAIPKQLTDGTFALASEGIAGSESALTFDQITSTPNIGSGWQEFTKLLLMQSNPSIETLVRDSLLSVATRGIDKYGLVGGGGITGLINETGPTPIIIGGDPDWSEIVSFETAIETADANIGDISWLMAPMIKGRAKTIPKIAGSLYSGWLMETNGEMNGYKSVISTILNQDPMNGYYLILGVFKQMWLATYGATEIQVNPFIKMKEGIVQVVLFSYFDWIVRQPTAFAISDDVTES